MSPQQANWIGSMCIVLIEVDPLLWNPESFGLTYQLFMSY
jgi:hypothetical protein